MAEWISFAKNDLIKSFSCLGYILCQEKKKKCVFFFIVWRRTLMSPGKWIKHANNKFTWCDFTIFSEQGSAESCSIRFQNLSYCFEYNQSFSRIFQSNFWRVFAIKTNYAAVCTGWRQKLKQNNLWVRILIFENREFSSK